MRAPTRWPGQTPHVRRSSRARHHLLTMHEDPEAVQQGAGRARAARPRSNASNIEVEVELVRRRAHPDGVELLVALEFQPLVDRVLREDVSLDQELMVLLDGVQG